MNRSNHFNYSNHSNRAQMWVLLLGAAVFVGFVVYLKAMARSVRKDAAKIQALEERDSHILQGAVITGKIQNDRRLLWTISQDDASQFALLLKQGINGNTMISNQPVCSIVAGKGAVRIMSLLLAQGTGVNARDRDGNTLLMEAASKGKCAMVDFLLAHGADVNATDKSGETALHGVVSHGYGMETVRDHLAVMQKLVQKGVNVNARTSFGSTPLMEAARYSKPEIIDFLLAHGADVNAVDKNGNTALDCTVERNYLQAHVAVAEKDQFAIMQKLFKQGASVNHGPHESMSPMSTAVQSSRMDMLRLLLAHGGDPNEKVIGNGSLLHFARQFKDSERNAEIVQMLIQAGAKE